MFHPSIFFCSYGAWLQGQLSEQGHPDFPLPGHFLQLFREDPKAFPGQPNDIVTPACPGSSSGSPPDGACQEHLLRASVSVPSDTDAPWPPQLAPLDVEEQRLFSEPLLGDRAPHPISKGAAHHLVEETHFGGLSPGCYSFSPDPKSMTIGEGRNVD